MWDAKVDIVVAGAGGCGLVAALAASEYGLDVAVFEKTNFILGNTAASAGMIPAAGTRVQREAGIIETPDVMAEDILRKGNYKSDEDVVHALCKESARLVEWLIDTVGLEMTLLEEFSYPGQSNKRMHAPPSRSGLELIKKLKKVVSEKDQIYLTLKSEVVGLVIEEGKITGVEVDTPNGKQRIKAHNVILATNGFGANKDMVAKYIPEISDALYFGYEANTGDAMKLGQQVDAAMGSMTAYQGHSAVAESIGILVTWGTIMMGGFMVNQAGHRFGDETEGYSEFAIQVLKQPNGKGYIIFDEVIFGKLRQMEDFKQISQSRGLKSAVSIDELAEKLNIPKNQLRETYKQFNEFALQGSDSFGRTVFSKGLKGKLYGVKVVPALFHTQGGLKINKFAQVLNKQNKVIDHLYAGGGAAEGISGDRSFGYMSGNGLLSALGLGKIAGEHAAKIINERRGSESGTTME